MPTFQVYLGGEETHLFEGKIWVEVQDCAIVRISGRLAKSPSFWIKHVDFERDYQRIGKFWLPSKEQAVSDVRFVGTRILTIDCHNKDAYRQ